MASTPGAEGLRLVIQGVVQGVGFRPTVWRIATELGLTGSVKNNGSGVVVEIWGKTGAQERFKTRLQREKPAASTIQSIDQLRISSPAAPPQFQILTSEPSSIATGISPDLAICPACISDISDPSSRFHNYPFTNCTACGPRYSILKALPYDRANTSMTEFSYCPLCKNEYENPENRRFHAQPIACQRCGPELSLEDHSGVVSSANDALLDCVEKIKRGEIVAIKGIGGFHLCCDATNHAAVEKLRQRKKRPAKPFALLATDLSSIRRYVEVSPVEKSLLSSAAAPIVLLKLISLNDLSISVAPGMNTLGFVLPYSPLHVLLMRHFAAPLVFTSANLAGDLLCSNNQEAREKLNGIADFWLMHDREIIHPVEDSVVRSSNNQTSILRMARGYTPTYIPLPPGFSHDQTILALGSELKNTFCIVQNGHAIVSPQFGDLSHPDVFRHYQEELNNFQHLFPKSPETYAIDHHPGYHSSQHGNELAQSTNKPLLKIQHHHAHIAACMAENAMPIDAPPLLGIVMDGMGLNVDGKTIWGGEFFIANYFYATHVAQIEPVCLPGGDHAMREPWRNTWAQLNHFFDWHDLKDTYPNLALVKKLQQKPLDLLETMKKRQINTPLASSCGRLFDAVAAALGICFDQITYEGQAAIELENLACSVMSPNSLEAYPFSLTSDALITINWKPLWQELIKDLENQNPPNIIAYRFHLCLSEAFSQLAFSLCKKEQLQTVILSGGVFQNQLLRQLTEKKLRQYNLKIFIPNQFPANDAGISLGQAVITSALSKNS